MQPGIPLSPLDRWIAAKIGEPGRPLSAAALAAYQFARGRETRCGWREPEAPSIAGAWWPCPKTNLPCANLASLPFTTAAGDPGLRAAIPVRLPGRNPACGHAGQLRNDRLPQANLLHAVTIRS